MSHPHQWKLLLPFDDGENSTGQHPQNNCILNGKDAVCQIALFDDAGDDADDKQKSEGSRGDGHPAGKGDNCHQNMLKKYHARAPFVLRFR